MFVLKNNANLVNLNYYNSMKYRRCNNDSGNTNKHKEILRKFE